MPGHIAVEAHDDHARSPPAHFGYRVAAVAIHDGHVLLHRAECDDFW
jgi:hypothetical protein